MSAPKTPRRKGAAAKPDSPFGGAARQRALAGDVHQLLAEHGLNGSPLVQRYIRAVSGA